MSLANAIDHLRSRGVQISRATLYRWDRELSAAGAAPLIHQPSGKGGRVFVVPGEVERHIRNRCSAVAPGDDR